NATELSIMSMNKEGVITSFNRAAEELLGYHSEEVIGKISPVIFHDLDEIIGHSQALSEELGILIEPGFECLVAGELVSRDAELKEWSFLHKNGTKIPVLLSLTGLWDEHDALIGYATIATNISREKRAHQKLRESASRLKALVNSMEDVIYEVDEDGRYVNIWARNESQLFMRRDKVLGKTLREIFGKIG